MSDEARASGPYRTKAEVEPLSAEEERERAEDLSVRDLFRVDVTRRGVTGGGDPLGYREFPDLVSVVAAFDAQIARGAALREAMCKSMMADELREMARRHEIVVKRHTEVAAAFREAANQKAARSILK